MTSTPHQSTSRTMSIAEIVGIGALLLLLYWPVLAWLARASVQVTQLSMGALLVVFAAVICLQDSLRNLRMDPQVNFLGVTLMALGIACLMLAPRIVAAALPLVIFSFCASFAAVVAFLFGIAGVRQFLPALVAFLVFGLLVGLFPALDWPLRAIAARYSGSFLAAVGAPVQLVIEPGRPAELVLAVGGRFFRVATECNGFGLLTSSLLLATILGFQFRLPWLNKIGLLAISVPAAIVFNFLRIVSICLVAPHVPLSYYLVHETIGTVFYFAGLAVIWLAARKAKGQAGVNEEVLSNQNRHNRI
jgi:exosortase/archaeosortase family protein